MPLYLIKLFKWKKKSLLFIEPEQMVEVLSLNAIDIAALEAGDSGTVHRKVSGRYLLLPITSPVTTKDDARHYEKSQLRT